MSLPFLAVKFFIPAPRVGIVPRTLLLARFSAGLARPLTLISAPAGFGKSTLLGQWAAQAQRCISWLSLDAAENDPARFWLYVCAAIQKPSRGCSTAQSAPLAEIMGMLQTSTPVTTPLLDALINAVTLLGEERVLALDDYHVVSSPTVQEGMAYLLDHLPPNLRLVIATRTDPPLPLSRLRARGALSEFRAADLRFAPEEARSLLAGLTGWDLPPQAVAAIEASAEGWAAGLQMAALALQAQFAAPGSQTPESIQQFVAAFSGKHMYVLDYLAEEVFNRQPAEIQSFLLQTSILAHLHADLCAAVTGRPAAECQQMLETLERSNLFLIALDHERQWYRYHNLFADLLRVRLKQAGEIDAPTLHQRAADWFEQQGRAGEAVSHAQAAGDAERIAALLERHIQDFLSRGQLTTVLHWIAALPQGVTRRRPLLAAQLVWAMSHAGQIKEIPALLQNMQESLQDPQVRGALAEEDAARVAGIAGIVQAYLLIMAGKPAEALAAAQAALAQMPTTAPAELAFTHWVTGYASRWVGELQEAEACFERAIAVSQSGGGRWEEMVFYSDLGTVYRLRGRLRQAARIYREALERGAALGLDRHGFLSRAESFLSGVLLEQNHLEEALRAARSAIERVKWWQSSNHIVQANVQLARALISAGKLEEAGAALQRAGEERRRSAVLPVIAALYEAAQVRLWLAQGDLFAARAWVDSVAPNGSIDEPRELRLLALARVRMACGQYDQALHTLAELESAARAGGRIAALVEIHTLQAVCLAHLRRTPEAAGRLAESLRLAGSEGFTRVYLDEGQPIAGLLKHLRGRQPEMDAEISRVLAAFPAPGDPRTGQPALVEELTGREIEVLRLLALGLSNREMAERLVVSEGTVKTHVHHLIAKLNAQSRTQAVAKARELGLV